MRCPSYAVHGSPGLAASASNVHILNRRQRHTTFPASLCGAGAAQAVRVHNNDLQVCGMAHYHLAYARWRVVASISSYFFSAVSF